MKVPVTILGVGERKSGIKRETGKPYDFYEVSIQYEDFTRMDGCVGEVVCIPTAMIDACPWVEPGNECHMDLSRFKFRTFVNAVYE